ncbi:MAG: hypothetical protein ACKVQS_10125 [Fimbriimonadaceae bacterium]
MKKQLPLPAVIAAVVAVLAVGIFFLMQAGKSGTEFEPAPVTGKTPDYILQSLPPEQRAKIEADEKRMGLDKKAQEVASQPQGNPYAGK